MVRSWSLGASARSEFFENLVCSFSPLDASEILLDSIHWNLDWLGEDAFWNPFAVIKSLWLLEPKPRLGALNWSFHLGPRALFMFHGY